MGIVNICPKQLSFSIAEANSAIERKGSCEGFRDHKVGFEISTYTLDKDTWSEGFVTQ